MNIVLIGVECAGKSTVAKAIAQVSDYECVDIDEIASSRLAETDLGLLAMSRFFLQVQNHIIEEIMELDHKVIAAGAMVSYELENMKKLRKNGVIFCLDASVETVIERQKDKPHWVQEGKDEFYIVRQNYEKDYEACKDYDYSISVSDEHTPEEYAKEILEMMEKLKL